MPLFIVKKVLGFFLSIETCCTPRVLKAIGSFAMSSILWTFRCGLISNEIVLSPLITLSAVFVIIGSGISLCVVFVW